MDELCTYRIEVRGQVDEDELNPSSPIQMTVERGEADTTLLTVCADQSGFVGLIRHLHGKGLVLLSSVRCQAPSGS